MISSGGSKVQVGSTAQDFSPFMVSLELIRYEVSSVQIASAYLNIHRLNSTDAEGR